MTVTASVGLAQATCLPGDFGTPALAGSDVVICLTDEDLLPEGFGAPGRVCLHFQERHTGHTTHEGWMHLTVKAWEEAAIEATLPDYYAGHTDYPKPSGTLPDPTFDRSQWPTFTIVVRPGAPASHTDDWNGNIIVTNNTIAVRDAHLHPVSGGSGFPPSHG